MPEVDEQPQGIGEAAEMYRTGGDIGIHGPSRSYSWLGGARNWVDWTAGCIAVDSDEVIDQIASWVIARRAAVVVIR